MTRVSVVMASYNHAPFIEQAIESILNQTMGDLELIIVDDGSVDASNDIVSSIRDERIIHIPLKHNGGACNAMNIAINRAKGEFVAVCNSDDVWEKDKIELQLDRFKSSINLGAVFSDVTWIDEFGSPIKEGEAGGLGQFRQENKMRHAWLRQLIETDNCLCHPSVLLRREVYDRVGKLDNMLRQLPDLDLWIRVLQHYEIFVMPEKLVKFRVHANNTSSPSPEKFNRLHREHMFIIKRFFSSVSPENFYASLYSNVSDSPKSRLQFSKDKVKYLLDAKWGFTKDLRDFALEMAFFGSSISGIEIIPALQFHDMTAAPVEQPVWPAVRRHLGGTIRSVLGEKLGLHITSSLKKIVSR